jgi:hypothetical protein
MADLQADLLDHAKQLLKWEFDPLDNPEKAQIFRNVLHVWLCKEIATARHRNPARPPVTPDEIELIWNAVKPNLERMITISQKKAARQVQAAGPTGGGETIGEAGNGGATTPEVQTGDDSQVPAPAAIPGQQPANHPDGPEDPHWLRLNGERHRIGQGRSKLSFLLLKYFWAKNTATYEDLQGPGQPWPDPVSDSAVATAVNRFNVEIPAALPWKLTTKNRHVTKESRENPAM